MNPNAAAPLGAEPDYHEMYRKVVALMVDGRALAAEQEIAVNTLFEKKRAYEQQKLRTKTMVELKADGAEIRAAREDELAKKQDMDSSKRDLEIIKTRIKINDDHRISILALRKDMRQSGG